MYERESDIGERMQGKESEMRQNVGVTNLDERECMRESKIRENKEWRK